jgi:glucokinase
VDLPAASDTEWAIHASLARSFGHVSAERVLCGSGLLMLYRFFGGSQNTTSPEAVSAAAKAGSDPAAGRAVAQFCAFLGAVAGNAVLTLGARGGVYLVGSILNDLGALLDTGPFLDRFQGKGRYRDYLASVPVRLASGDDLGLAGALRYLRRAPAPA